MDWFWIVLGFPAGDWKDPHHGSTASTGRVFPSLDGGKLFREIAPLIVLGSHNLVMSSSLENVVSSKCKLGETAPWYPYFILLLFLEFFKRGFLLRY